MACSCGSSASTLDSGPAGLAPGERLILWSLRTWGEIRTASKSPEMFVHCGVSRIASGRSASLVCATMALLERGLTRPLNVQCPKCPGYAPDEQRLVVSFGVTPVAPDIAAELIAPIFVDTVMLLGMAKAVNGALACDGLALPVRLSGPSCFKPNEPIGRGRMLH